MGARFPLPARAGLPATIFFGLPDSREGGQSGGAQMGVVTKPRENQSTIREEIKVLFRLIVGRKGLIVSLINDRHPGLRFKTLEECQFRSANFGKPLVRRY